MSKQQILDKEPNKNVTMVTYSHLRTCAGNEG